MISMRTSELLVANSLQFPILHDPPLSSRCVAMHNRVESLLIPSGSVKKSINSRGPIGGDNLGGIRRHSYSVPLGTTRLAGGMQLQGFPSSQIS
jgi:hypothetical protein